jgi:hypothetical protein
MRHALILEVLLQLEVLRLDCLDARFVLGNLLRRLIFTLVFRRERVLGVGQARSQLERLALASTQFVTGVFVATCVRMRQATSSGGRRRRSRSFSFADFPQAGDERFLESGDFGESSVQLLVK